MSTTTTTAPGSNLVGKLGTWLMIVATVGLAFIICVEMINILFMIPGAMRNSFSNSRAVSQTSRSGL